MAVKVMEPYRNLSHEELLNKVYEFGAAYEKTRTVALNVRSLAYTRFSVSQTF